MLSSLFLLQRHGFYLPSRDKRLSSLGRASSNDNKTTKKLIILKVFLFHGMNLNRLTENSMHCKKKFIDFPLPSRDVIHQSLPGRE
jgi:hypothetical protein